MRLQIKVELQWALQPHTFHLAKFHYAWRHSHRSIEKANKNNKKKQKGHQAKCRLWGGGPLLHWVRKSVAAPREVKKYHKSSYKNNQKHSLKKLGQPQAAMEKSQLAPIPLVPLFSVSLFLLLLSPHKIRNIFPPKAVNIPKNAITRNKKRMPSTSENTDSTGAKWMSSENQDRHSEFPPFSSSSGLKGCPEEWDHS